MEKDRLVPVFSNPTDGHIKSFEMIGKIVGVEWPEVLLEDLMKQGQFGAMNSANWEAGEKKVCPSKIATCVLSTTHKTRLFWFWWRIALRIY